VLALDTKTIDNASTKEHEKASMNRLTTQDRARILTALSEGVGINTACRMTGASKNTVLKRMADVGEACSLYQHRVMRNLQRTQIQVDEIWSFVGMKQKNAPEGLAGV
jgi:DNA-directed RNA polymerase specialized sigma24 family protein